MNKEPLSFQITPRQYQFLTAREDEILFGGAAGGGKSYGQLIDAFVYALTYPGSHQLLLRRTLPELENSLIRAAEALYPRGIYHYFSSKHKGVFRGGSVLDFGYCGDERDVYRYQSAEYDVIRFDELTHFTEEMYLYLMSRLRGAAPFPRQMKSSTNPGGLGHQWVKARFVDPAPPDTLIQDALGSRRFIPARVQENRFLMRGDPGYLNRLRRLPDRERRALLEGDWDLTEGRFFTRWSVPLHVAKPFPVPPGWRRYLAIDYGLDMFAGLFVAEDEQGFYYVYHEVYEPGLLVSEAAGRIRETGEQPAAVFAPPDLWSRQKDSGRSIADLFREGGFPLTRVSAARTAGWAWLNELLLPVFDRDGVRRPRLRVFSTCRNLIRCLPALQWDPHCPGDCATKPHEWTHAPDALRYFVAGVPGKKKMPPPSRPNGLGGYQKELIL